MDLSTNRPGTAAQSAARALVRARPVPTLLARLRSRTTSDTELREAAEAERRTAITLDRLGSAWRVLHSVPLGPDRRPISHLVIGPAGVFTVLPSLHRVWRRQLNPERVTVRVLGDDVLVDGIARPYVPQARTQAWQAARVLSAAAGEPVHVRPLVVIVGPEDLTFHTAPDRVEVLGRRHLPRRLREFPIRYSPDRANAVHEIARRADLWVDFGENENDGVGPGEPGPTPSRTAWVRPAG
jgi:hypothetical protein